jgi:hypothetical protein
VPQRLSGLGNIGTAVNWGSAGVRRKRAVEARIRWSVACDAPRAHRGKPRIYCDSGRGDLQERSSWTRSDTCIYCGCLFLPYSGWPPSKRQARQLVRAAAAGVAAFYAHATATPPSTDATLLVLSAASTKIYKQSTRQLETLGPPCAGPGPDCPRPVTSGPVDGNHSHSVTNLGTSYRQRTCDALH